jgi:hypothetical protein
MSDPANPENPFDPGRPLDATQRMPQYTPQDPPAPGGPDQPGGPGGRGGPPPGGGGPGDGEDDGSFWDSVPPWAAAIVGGVVVLVVVLAIALLAGGDDDDGDDVATDATPEVTETPEETPTPEETATEEPTAEPDPTPTPVATPTPEPTATPEPEPTATPEPPPVDPEAYASAVWPWFDSGVRYTEPVAAARGFATDFVGFTDPVVGEFMQGDSRSGEVEIRPRDNGPVTTVFVRQLGPDDTWWVLGSATGNIEVDEPDALDEITSPLEVRGSALAFEGNVNVDIRVDGEDDPLFEGFVTGGGGEMASFDDDLDWDNPGEGSGAVVFKTISAEDGQVWEAAVVRVTFG